MERKVYNILMIDDDAIDRAAIIQLLKKSKSYAFYILEATNVTDGLAYYLDSPADCILLDYLLPGQNGLEFIHLIAQQTKNNLPAIIVLTAHGDENTAVSLLKAGALDYLKKDGLSSARLIKTIVTSIARKKENEKIINKKNRLAYEASHDELTQLFNRRGLEDTLNQLIVMSKRHHQLSAILFCDLDKFKQVNDTMGHHVGDLLLKKVAARLKKTVRKKDSLARLGGDEFVILLKNISNKDHLAKIATQLCKVISAPFHIHHVEINITISIGMTCIPSNTDDFTSLIKQADSAMYCAKALQPGGYKLYNESSTLPANKQI